MKHIDYETHASTGTSPLVTDSSRVAAASPGFRSPESHRDSWDWKNGPSLHKSAAVRPLLRRYRLSLLCPSTADRLAGCLIAVKWQAPS